MVFLVGGKLLNVQAAEKTSHCGLGVGLRLPVILAYGQATKLADSERDSPLDFTVAELEAQIDALRSGGYSLVSLKEFSASLENGRALPEKSVAFTFEGAARSQEAALSALQRKQVPATFFVVSGWIGKRIGEQPQLAWSDLRAWLAKYPGLEIGSLSRSYPDFKATPAEAIERELDVSLKEIADGLGAKRKAVSAYLAYPEGSYDDLAAKLAGPYFSLAFTRSNDPNASLNLDHAIDVCYQVPRLALDPAYRAPERLLRRVSHFRDQLEVYSAPHPMDSRTPASEGSIRPLRTFNKR